MPSDFDPFGFPVQDADGLKNESVYFGQVIHVYRTRKNLSQNDLADLLHVDRNSVANWEGGRSRPPLEVVPRLCDLLEVPMETFFNMPRREDALSLEEQDALALFHRLNPHDREVVSAILASLQAHQKLRLRRRCLTDFVTLRRINLHDGLFPEEKEGPAEKPFFVRRSPLTETATHVAAVQGDAMEPAFRGGSDVYLRRTGEVCPGDIVCASVNGRVVIREYQPGLLHALNPLRGDLKLDASVHCLVLGKVLGPVPKQDLPGEKEQEMLEILHWEKEQGENGIIIKRTSR